MSSLSRRLAVVVCPAVYEINTAARRTAATLTVTGRGRKADVDGRAALALGTTGRCAINAWFSRYDLVSSGDYATPTGLTYAGAHGVAGTTRRQVKD